MSGTNSPTGMDAAIEAYKAGVDRTLLRESLRLSVAQRLDRLQELYDFAMAVRKAGRAAFPRTGTPAPPAP